MNYIKNQIIPAVVKLKTYDVLTTKANKPYAKIKFQNSQKQLFDSRLWTLTDTDRNTLNNNKYFVVQLQYTPYNGMDQFKVINFYAIQEEEVPDLDAFEVINGKNATILNEYLHHVVETLPEGFQQLIFAIWEEYPSFFTIPAAKSIHHAYKYGLLEHTTSIVKQLVHLHRMGLYANIDWNLAITGAILHDIGKVVTYSGDDDGVVPNYRETLFSHLYEGASIIKLVNSKKDFLPTEIVELLEHILLSHHGKKDWGALVVPATPEAILVAMLDNLDATMTIVKEVAEQNAEGLTEKIYPLDTKLFFNN